MLDAHFHLNSFTATELPSLVAAARAAGVHGGVVASLWNDDTRVSLSRAMDTAFQVRVGARFRNREESDAGHFNVFLAHGLHPMGVGQRWICEDGQVNTSQMAADKAEFREILLNHRKLIWAVGETGFDLSRQMLALPGVARAGKECLITLQADAFGFCLECAQQFDLPVIVHTRNAWQRTLSLLEPYVAQGLRAMLHCYGGSPDELPRLARQGIWVSFGGVLTWQDSKKAREAARACPSQILMVETDAPDLAPLRPDGRRPDRNTPAELATVVDALAALRGESRGRIAEMSDANLRRFLGLRGVAHG